MHKLAQVVEPIIRSAGTLIMDYFHKGSFAIEYKPGDQGLVTQADKECQKYLIAQLQKVLPQAGIIAEEAEPDETTGQYCWVIDPLDGTTNFAHGIPYFCISVALTEYGRPIFGVIYQPTSDEFFWAQEGYGAYLNNSKIQACDPIGVLKENLVVGVPYLSTVYEKLFFELQREQAHKYTVRKMGSVLLDIAYVASGRMNGVFFTDLAWWDVAAGVVLIEQAGGIITDFKGQKVLQGYVSCVAGTPAVHEALITFISSKA